MGSADTSAGWFVIRFPRLVAGLSMLGLVACTSAPLPATDAPALPAGFAHAGAKADVANALLPPADGRWWTVFADAELDAWVARSLAGSTSLQQAAARLAQARALSRAAGAERAPQLNLNAAASRQGGPLVNAAGEQGTLLEAGAAVSYELDVFGRLARTGQAATLDVQSREALLRAASLLVQAETAQTYFSLRAQDDEIAVLRATVALQQRVLQVQEGRLRNGLVPEHTVAQARADLASAEAQVLALAPRRAELHHALAFLAGVHAAETPEIAPATAIAATPQPDTAPPALPVVPAGIPSRVIARRPDVAAAGHALAAARTRLGVAQDAWLPDLELTARGGFASPQLSDLLRSAARSWGLGALLALPVFDGGRRAAGIDHARAELELAAAGYREQVLLALREVEDRLAALKALAAQAEHQQAASDETARTASRTQSRRECGLASELDVIEAERIALRERRTLQQVQAARRQATVGLVRALGGGWDANPASVALARP